MLVSLLEYRVTVRQRGALDNTTKSVMEELERLDRCLREPLECPGVDDDRPEDIDCLRQRVQRLQGKRNDLQQEIKESRQYVRDVLNVNVEGHERSTPPTATYGQLVAMKKQKLDELKKSYRLIGTSAVAENPDLLRLCFDTCHQGRFLESYYVELEMREETEFKVVRHSLPHFLPLEALCESLNASRDLPEFTRAVHTYLTAYVSRREEREVTKEKYRHHLVGDIVTTLAHDFIEFTVSGDVHGCPLEVTLVYADLKATLPGAVEVKCKEWDQEHDVIQTWTESLRTLRLSKAFNNILSNQTVD